MRRSNHLFCVFASFFLSIIPVSLQANESSDSLDEICKSAIAGDVDVETRVLQYAKDYLTGIIRITSNADAFKMRQSDALYIIAGKIDLDGKTITVPDRSVLFFRNDSQFQNGTIIGNGTRIVSSNQIIFPKGRSTYRGYLKGTRYSYATRRQRALIVGGIWSNKAVGEKWTELKTGEERECQSLSLNNLITLFSREIIAEIPRGEYYIYDWVRITNRSVDFNGSLIYSIDFNRVEDNSIELPSGSKATSLRSRYGLVDFNGAGMTLKNVIIDGRSSSRNEKAKLGSECLITIAEGSDGGIFENVVIKDAVDCDICTGAIKGFFFRNVIFGPCGEHGLYTHAYDGELVFENCIFDSCGQSPDLFLKKGISGCVRGAASRDRNAIDYAGLKAVFSNCTFRNTGSFSVATLYTDIPKADFYRCQWIGKVAGYIANNPSFNEETGQLYEYRFYYCDNPCGKHNAKNTVRVLVGCKSVRNPFEDTYLVENCDVIVTYDDVNNRYEGSFSAEINRPLVFMNCVFYKPSIDGGVRTTIINPRPMSFISCSWEVPMVKTKEIGQSLIYLEDEQERLASDKWVSFQDCSFNVPHSRLLTCCDTRVSFLRGEYLDSYDVLVLGGEKHPNHVIIESVSRETPKLISRY